MWCDFFSDKLFLWDEAQGAAEQMTKIYDLDRQGMSEHATQRIAHKNSL
jgi:hypothetical protein